MNEETVEITIEEYEKLIENDLFLTALIQAGVDNWTGYDFAFDIYDNLKEG